MRYAQRINRVKGWKGHLWQGRFFSSPLDEVYTWSAIRYVEQNPVRVGIVEKAEEYLWSSAAAHCGLIDIPFLAAIEKERPVSAAEWSGWLGSSGKEKPISVLRRNVREGTPLRKRYFYKETGMYG